MPEKLKERSVCGQYLIERFIKCFIILYASFFISIPLVHLAATHTSFTRFTHVHISRLILTQYCYNEMKLTWISCNLNKYMLVFKYQSPSQLSTQLIKIFSFISSTFHNQHITTSASASINQHFPFNEITLFIKS